MVEWCGEETFGENNSESRERWQRSGLKRWANRLYNILLYYVALTIVMDTMPHIESTLTKLDGAEEEQSLRLTIWFEVPEYEGRWPVLSHAVSSCSPLDHHAPGWHCVTWASVSESVSVGWHWSVWLMSDRDQKGKGLFSHQWLSDGLCNFWIQLQMSIVQ